MMPLLVSKISLLVGLILLGTILVRKHSSVAALPKEMLPNSQTFKDFLLEILSSLKFHWGEFFHFLKRWYYRAAAVWLHQIKLISLRLESYSTKWLANIKKAAAKPQEQPLVMTSEEKPFTVDNTRKNDVQEEEKMKVTQMNSQDFFAALKDIPNHEKLKDKLLELKENEQNTKLKGDSDNK